MDCYLGVTAEGVSRSGDLRASGAREKPTAQGVAIPERTTPVFSAGDRVGLVPLRVERLR